MIIYIYHIINKEEIDLKKTIFGVLLTVVGLVLTVSMFNYATHNVIEYNNIQGLYGSILGNEMLVPCIFSGILTIIGLLIVCFEAYRKES